MRAQQYSFFDIFCAGSGQSTLRYGITTLRQRRMQNTTRSTFNQQPAFTTLRFELIVSADLPRHLYEQPALLLLPSVLLLSAQVIVPSFHRSIAPSPMSSFERKASERLQSNNSITDHLDRPIDRKTSGPIHVPDGQRMTGKLSAEGGQ